MYYIGPELLDLATQSLPLQNTPIREVRAWRLKVQISIPAFAVWEFCRLAKMNEEPAALPGITANTLNVGSSEHVCEVSSEETVFWAVTASWKEAIKFLGQEPLARF